MYLNALYGVTTHGAETHRFTNRAASERVAATNALVSRHATEKKSTGGGDGSRNHARANASASFARPCATRANVIAIVRGSVVSKELLSPKNTVRVVSGPSKYAVSTTIIKSATTRKPAKPAAAATSAPRKRATLCPYGDARLSARAALTTSSAPSGAANRGNVKRDHVPSAVTAPARNAARVAEFRARRLF